MADMTFQPAGTVRWIVRTGIIFGKRHHTGNEFRNSFGAPGTAIDNEAGVPGNHATAEFSMGKALLMNVNL